MGYEVPAFNINIPAAASFLEKRYYLVKIDSNGKAALAGAGENAVGVLQKPAIANEACVIMTLGISKVIYGGNVTAGSNITPDAAGKAVTAGGTDAVVGVALESGSANNIGTVLLVTRTATGTTGLAKSNSVISIPVDLAQYAATGDIATTYIPGFAGTIKSVAFMVTEAGAGTDAEVDVNLEVGTTNVTGGVVALTLAGTATVGAVVAGTAITDNAGFLATDSISLEATVTTAFTGGKGTFLITVEQ